MQSEAGEFTADSKTPLCSSETTDSDTQSPDVFAGKGRGWGQAPPLQTGAMPDSSDISCWRKVQRLCTETTLHTCLLTERSQADQIALR